MSLVIAECTDSYLGRGDELVYLTTGIALVVGCGGESGVAEFKGRQDRQCGCFGNICTCIYCVFVLFRLCIFILICY